MRNDPNDDRIEEVLRNIIKDRNLELDRTYAERNEYYNENLRLKAEARELRGLLREAHVKMVDNNVWRNLRARIDAALAGKGEGDV